MTIPIVRYTLTGLCVAVLAACSGGGAGAPPAPRATPTVPPSPANTSKSNVMVSFALHSPTSHGSSSVRHRDYVSPSTVGVILSVHDTTANTTATTGYDVSPQPDPNTSCGPTQANGARSCQLGIFAQSGDTIVVTATVYDAIPSPLGANPTANGHALATGASAATQIVAGQANNITITLAGIIAGIATQYVGGSSTPVNGRLALVTVHPIDYGGNQIDAFDNVTAYNNSVTVQIGDAGDVSDCQTKCASWDFGQTSFLKTISNPKTDASAGAEGAFQAFYQQVTSATGTHNAGDEATKPPYYARVYTNPNPNPNSPSNGEIDVVPLFAAPSTLTFSTTGAKTLYAAQFHAPDGATGYTIDNACGGLISASAPSAATWGAQFSLTPLTNGSCTAHLSDGAGDTVGATVTINAFTTHAITQVQAKTGGSAGAPLHSTAASLTAKPTLGNTIVIIAAEGATALTTPAGYTQVDNFPLAGSLQGYAVFVKDVTDATADQNATLAYSGASSVTGPISWFMGEYHNTAANLFSSVTLKGSNAFGTGGSSGSSSTSAITTDSSNAMVFSAASSSLSGQGASGATDPYTASTGWSEFFAAGASSTSTPCVPAGSLDVQTMAQTSAGTISNTFSVSASGNVNGAPPCTGVPQTNPNTDDIIFYARSKS